MTISWERNTPYVSALSNAETRADGRPIFFVEGRFDDAAAPDYSQLLEQAMTLYRWNDHGTQIGSVQSNGYALYFTDATVCDKSGRVIPAADASVVEAAKLPDIAYRICLRAESEHTEEDGRDTYTLSLDAAGMEAVAYAIAPAAEGMDIAFAGGSLRVVLRGGRIECIEADCRGTVQVVLSRAEVAFSVRMEFEEGAEAPALPDAVREALAR